MIGRVETECAEDLHSAKEGLPLKFGQMTSGPGTHPECTRLAHGFSPSSVVDSLGPKQSSPGTETGPKRHRHVTRRSEGLPNLVNIAGKPRSKPAFYKKGQRIRLGKRELPLLADGFITTS